jgi:hypothetical protein
MIARVLDINISTGVNAEFVRLTKTRGQTDAVCFASLPRRSGERGNDTGGSDFANVGISFVRDVNIKRPRPRKLCGTDAECSGTGILPVESMPFSKETGQGGSLSHYFAEVSIDLFYNYGHS